MNEPSFRVDVFWSFRSPYCYFSLDRLEQLNRSPQVEVVIRPVYPMAVRNPTFFRDVNPKYRKYHTLDCLRVAERLAIPFRRPIPDPIIQNLETSEISSDQPYIRELTRLGAAAQALDQSVAFMNSVMRLIWDGSVDGWNEGRHLQDAIDKTGLDGKKLIDDVRADPEKFERIIAENQKAHDDSDHWGVPLFTFRGETFYGQDRINALIWRMQTAGLKN